MESIFSALANKTTKTSKRVAWYSWLELADNDKFIQGLNYSERRAFIELGSFFIPTVSKARVTADALQWVAKACGVKDLRKYLNHVHVDGGKMVASDGHRLHVVYKDLEPLEYSEGFICKVSGRVIGDQGTFPNVERIIPNKLSWHKCDEVLIQNALPKNSVGVPTIDSKKRLIKLSTQISSDVKLVSDTYVTSLFLSEQYYNDSISGLGENYEVAICGAEGKVLFRNKSGSRLALVMSVRTEDEEVYLD